ncbi:hypothetical protein [Sulfitobacter aestuariivivens]|uniref:Cytochrome c domain-containing protein n=1 Tax=Sulfitobacter aestuariivivens TaxID=2766981 RepID=A0A927D7C4_9RHOB|nr:hypothetical protein [Sulfitobacter aestuariivivens]MBD3664111.1 hypothetical protein [Sulfitobacter aestuariivivens]
MRILLIAGLLAAAAPLMAAEDQVVISPPAEGSVNLETGLAAWDRIYEVASHPRCSNCHVGDSDQPMWSGPSYGAPRPHGMNIRAGDSRIGAETIPCRTCHVTNETGGNDMPHGAPQVADAWQLPPVEADWFGRTSDEICAQLRDPERNDGRTFMELADHLGHDVILHWAWNPGGTREAAPYSLQEHVDDLLIWGVAGMPCHFD